MEAQRSHHAFRQRAYGMKKHAATYLHYDLRLEWNGVLLSWALREGPSLQPGVFRKAVEMDDHRLAYLLFEGLHRTGTIMLWDRGTWAPYPECEDIEASVRRGILRFALYGEKLQGGWTLARTNTVGIDSRPLWTLRKHADKFAESWAGRCILLEQPNSITGKTMEGINQEWMRPKKRHERQANLFDQFIEEEAGFGSDKKK